MSGKTMAMLYATLALTGFSLFGIYQPHVNAHIAAALEATHANP